jgi:hypothetical protein
MFIKCGSTSLTHFIWSEGGWKNGLKIVRKASGWWFCPEDCICAGKICGIKRAPFFLTGLRSRAGIWMENCLIYGAVGNYFNGILRTFFLLNVKRKHLACDDGKNCQSNLTWLGLPGCARWFSWQFWPSVKSALNGGQSSASPHNIFRHKIGLGNFWFLKISSDFGNSSVIWSSCDIPQ